jgi:hypothetical protein
VWILRLAALMGAGTFAVHQLRFAISYDHGAGAAQAMAGHGYLVPAGAVLAGLLLLALAAALARVARGAADDHAPRFWRLWPGASAGLFAVYCVQESIEASLTIGQPASVPGVLEHGGWVALPLSVVVGLAVALIMRGAAAATALVAARRPPWRAPAPDAPVQAVLPPWTPRSTDGTALHLAARGPPGFFL